MKGVPVKWTEEEKAFVLNNYKGVLKKDLCKRMQEELGSDKTPTQLKSFYVKYKLCSGVDCKIKKGNVPPNKGKPLSPEVYKRVSKTFFRKGNKPHNTLPVGSEILHTDKCGKKYWYVKIAEPRTWKPKHHLLWESVNGPVPKDCIIVFLDGDTDNITIDNLRCITKAENILLNHIYSGEGMTADERNIAIDLSQIQTRINKRLRG